MSNISNTEEDKNKIFHKPNVVTNKRKISTAFIAAGAIGFIGIAAGSNYFATKQLEETEQKKKDVNSDGMNTPVSNTPTQWDNMPNYINQNQEQKDSITHVSNQNNEVTNTQVTDQKNIGDQEISTIDKQSEKKARESDTEIDKINQQLNAEKSIQNIEDSEIYLGSKKKAAKSPFEIMSGSVIPATLQTGLNSELPGYATAIVRQNVYDSVSGNFLLVPKGTKIFGKYESKVAYGQKRLLMQWDRLIFTDGSSISLKGMQGTDKEGYSGFEDQVDNHFASLMSGAILMSIIGAGAQLSQPNNQNNGTYPSTQQQVGQTIAGQMGTQIATISGQVVQKNMNIQPTIVIRPGYEFNIMVSKDIILEPIKK